MLAPLHTPHTSFTCTYGDTLSNIDTYVLDLHGNIHQYITLNNTPNMAIIITVYCIYVDPFSGLQNMHLIGYYEHATV